MQRQHMQASKKAENEKGQSGRNNNPLKLNGSKQATNKKITRTIKTEKRTKKKEVHSKTIEDKSW